MRDNTAVINLVGTVSGDNAIEWIDDLYNYLADDEVKRIIVNISSNGGDANACLAICNMICMSTKPIETRVVGMAFSGACYITMCGHERKAMANSLFALHSVRYFGQPSNIRETLRDVSDNYDEMKHTQSCYDAIVEYKTNIKYKLLHTHINNGEWYFNAPEAPELGVIDEISEFPKPKKKKE